MTEKSAPYRSRSNASPVSSLRARLGAAAMVFLLHIALLLVLTHTLIRRHASQNIETGVLPMTIYNLKASASPQPFQDGALTAAIKKAASPVSKNPPKPVQMPPIPDPDPKLPAPRLDTEPIPIGDAASPAQTPSVFAVMPIVTDTCDLVPILTSTLATDTRVSEGLRLVPLKSRSVANAIMLWDGAWVNPASLGGAAAIAPIRAALISAIQGAPPKCLEEIVTGPRLLPVSDRYGTAVIAIGSGRWQWKNLLSETVPKPP